MGKSEIPIGALRNSEELKHISGTSAIPSST